MSGGEPPRILVIEGEIAAGKSTLLARLAEHLRGKGHRVATVAEPVAEWVSAGILQKFYGDPERYAYEFQTFVYTTRIQAIVRELAGASPDVVVLERSPASDRMFMAIQNVDGTTRTMYEAWAGIHDLLLPFPLRDAEAIYLAPSLAECARRLRRRDRPGEVAGDGDDHGVTDGYQHRLRAAHEAFLVGAVGAPRTAPYRCVHVLRTDEEFTPDFLERLVSGLGL